MQASEVQTHTHKRFINIKSIANISMPRRLRLAEHEAGTWAATCNIAVSMIEDALSPAGGQASRNKRLLFPNSFNFRFSFDSREAWFHPLDLGSRSMGGSLRRDGPLVPSGSLGCHWFPGGTALGQYSFILAHSARLQPVLPGMLICDRGRVVISPISKLQPCIRCIWTHSVRDSASAAVWLPRRPGG